LHGSKAKVDSFAMACASAGHVGNFELLEFLPTFWAMGSVDNQDRGAELAGLNKGAEQVGHEGRGVMTTTQESHIHGEVYHRLAIEKIPIKESPWHKSEFMVASLVL
jgi:hypothetical protein